MRQTVSVTVGTCGYSRYRPPDDWRDTYDSTLQAFSHAFPSVELNSTFYSLPRQSTAERWRREAAEDFTVTLKAWQAMTHPWSSPTWNDHRDDVPDDRTDDVGYLQPTDAVVSAWQETRARAEALEAPVVVVQTPPSFDATEEHAENVRALFDRIDRGDLTVAWEPRGTWLDRLDWVGDLCEDLDLVHVVDLFRDEPRSSHDTAYVRLHGRNEDRFEYDYDYADDELDDLAARLRDLDRDHDHVYCMFNNYEMFENARGLLERL